MSIYAISDLHGLKLSEFKKLLDKADFNDEDWLYILGDVIDRQNDGGVETLKWLLEQSNVQLILGNHEAMLLACDFVFDEVTDKSVDEFSQSKMNLLMHYIQNGGDVTLTALKALKDADPDTVYDIMDYLRDAPLYEAVSVGGKDYLLLHSGIKNFDKNKKMSEYTEDEILWARPQFADKYFDGIKTVFGHTPTFAYGDEFKGKILHTDTWIDIDVGVPYGNPPTLLRLDDLKEFYL